MRKGYMVERRECLRDTRGEQGGTNGLQTRREGEEIQDVLRTDKRQRHMGQGWVCFSGREDEKITRETLASLSC